MYAFSDLPQLYKIAVLLGARVEVYLEQEGRWVNHADITGITDDTSYRIVAQDQEVMEQVKEIVNKLHTKVQFKGFDYLIPNNAMKEGSIILMKYSMGMYVKMQKDGSFLDLDTEHAKTMLKDTGTQPFYAQAVRVFEGNKINKEIKD